MPRLFIVATPIGNLEDLTFRAARILGEVDYIAAEDTRVTAKLLQRYNIKKSLLLWHQHSRGVAWHKVKAILAAGHDIALVTDAGTPGVSDPGNMLVSLVAREMPEVTIVPVPGASAMTTIMSVAGIALDSFMFLGFLPHKKGRQTALARIAQSDVPVIFFESVHRIRKTLTELAKIDKSIIVGRELTKAFETIYRGQPSEVLKQLTPSQEKGEFVIIVGS